MVLTRSKPRRPATLEITALAPARPLSRIARPGAETSVSLASWSMPGTGRSSSSSGKCRTVLHRIGETAVNPIAHVGPVDYLEPPRITPQNHRWHSVGNKLCQSVQHVTGASHDSRTEQKALYGSTCLYNSASPRRMSPSPI